MCVFKEIFGALEERRGRGYTEKNNASATVAEFLFKAFPEKVS